MFRRQAPSSYVLCHRCKIEKKKGKPDAAGYAVRSRDWESHLWIVHGMKKIKSDGK